MVSCPLFAVRCDGLVRWNKGDILYSVVRGGSTPPCPERISDSLRFGYLKHGFKECRSLIARLKFEVLTLAIKVFPLFRL